MPRNPAAKTSQPEAIANQPEAVAVLDEPKPPKKKSALGVAPVPAQAPPSPMLAEEIEREKRLAESREELAFRRADLLASGEDLSVDEFRVMKTAIPGCLERNGPAWRVEFDRFLAKQNARVGRILELQSAAGTPAERQKADGLERKTAAELDEKSPGIEEQIHELQKRLDALRSTASDAKQAAETRHKAVADLHDKRLLPNFIRDELASIERRHSHDFGKELINLETRRTQIEVLLALDVANPEGLTVAKLHVGGNSRFGPDDFERREHMFHCSRTDHGISVSFATGRLRADRWADYLADLLDELGIVETHIKEIAGGKQAAADEAVEKLKSFYVPE